MCTFPSTVAKAKVFLQEKFVRNVLFEEKQRTLSLQRYSADAESHDVFCIFILIGLVLNS